MAKLKPSVTMAYLGVFVLLVAMVFIGYSQPQKISTAAVESNSDLSKQIIETSVDDMVATNVAAGVAQVANLPIATAVSNLAVSAQTKSEFTQTDNAASAKPQIIDSSSTNRSVVSYTVVEGDTVDTLAVKFSISKDTIKWANKLTSDTLTVGKVLRILPVDGVLYSVKAGDTIDSIATKYGVDKTRLVLFNDLDVSGLTPNTDIILPSGTLPDTEKPGYVAPTPISYYSTSYGSSNFGRTWFISYGTPSEGRPYTFGNCTLYAFNRRVELGLPVGGYGGYSNWGHAYTWDDNARSAGLTVDHNPSVGAIIQNDGAYGHVGIVESKSPNGDISISEMNAYVSGGGYNIVSGRIIYASEVSKYNYIH